MSYQEKHFQSALNKWLKKNWDDGSCAMELKITKGKSLPYSALKEHQLYGLNKCNHGTLVWKLSDMDMRMKPFDAFILQKVDAYIVIMFYEPRKKKVAYIISVYMWEFTKKHSKRKSITEAECEKIAHKIINL